MPEAPVPRSQFKSAVSLLCSTALVISLVWGVATVLSAHLHASAGERAVDRQAMWTIEMNKNALQRLHRGSTEQD